MFNNQRKTLAKEYHELYMNNNTETRKNKHLNERKPGNGESCAKSSKEDENE